MGGKRAAKWYRWDEVPREELHERLSRRLITGDQVMLAHVYLKQGCVVPKHSHENEQFTYILEGALRFLVGEEADEIVVRAGEIGSTRRTRTCGGRKRILRARGRAKSRSFAPAALRMTGRSLCEWGRSNDTLLPPHSLLP